MTTRSALFPRPLPTPEQIPGGRQAERGSVMLEAAILTPLLLLLVLGVFDLGMGWKASTAVTGAARAGARVASNLGTDALTDSETLRAVAATLSNEGLDNIDRVVIFRSTDPDGVVPSACLSEEAKTAGGVQTSSCNVYVGSELEAIIDDDSSAPSFEGSCDAGASRDWFWCPSNRVTSQLYPGPDYLGVYIRLIHPNSTKVFSPTVVIDDTAVMRLEPRTVGS